MNKDSHFTNDPKWYEKFNAITGLKLVPRYREEQALLKCQTLNDN